MTSSKPDVVTSATRAPFLCNKALVPTVVPWCSVRDVQFVLEVRLCDASPIFLRASAMAREGSSGVENTFKFLSTPSSIQTQSVKVPPVSIAMRSSLWRPVRFGWRLECDAVAMNGKDYHYAC